MAKKNVSEYRSQPPKEKPPFETPSDSMAMLDRLIDWMEDFQEWGEQVREDILRLEAEHPDLAQGDPGPPPPPPWKTG